MTSSQLSMFSEQGESSSLLLLSSPRATPDSTAQPLSTPASLQTYNHGKLVAWEKDQAVIFLEWWIHTAWYVKNERRPKEQRMAINWASKASQAGYWEHFVQVAQQHNGKPAVWCTRCDMLLGHPHMKSEKKNGDIGVARIGNSGLKNHLRSERCALSAKRKELPHLSVHDLMQPASRNRAMRTGAAARMNGLRLNANDFAECQLRMVVLRGLPLTVFNNPEVQRSYFCFIDPDRINFGNKTTIQQRIIQRAETIREDIRNDMQSDESRLSHIGLQVDGWSQKNSRTNYFATIAHWISTDMKWHEALLDFTPTEAQHGGVQLAELMQGVISQYDIMDRVTTITSDNASPNRTMTAALNNETLEWNLSSRSILRIPCLSHVIQLAQGDLLEGIKCRPTNEEIIRLWDEEEHERQRCNYNLRANLPRSRNPNQGPRADEAYGVIPITLWKAREISKYICASEGRRLNFKSIQDKLITASIPGPPDNKFWIRQLKRPLMPIQDVKTRWDSTTQMCIRLRVLKRALHLYLSQPQMDKPWLEPTEDEWTQVEYLIYLTAPYNAFTQTIGRSKGPSVHNVYQIYDWLFDHIERSIHRLRHKTASWKIELKDALYASKDKLKKYYSQTERSRDLDHHYAFAALLHPHTRNTAFTSTSWQTARGNVAAFRDKYKRALRVKWESEYKGDIDTEDASLAIQDDSLDLVRGLFARPSLPSLSGPALTQRNKDELHRYFEQCDSSASDPLAAWQDNRNYERFPTVARMARDYLCSPSGTVGVERTFCDARRQSEFNRTYAAKTFQAIMVCKARMAYMEKEEQQDYEAVLEALGDTGSKLLPDEAPVEADTRKHHVEAVLREYHDALISDNEDEDEEDELIEVNTPSRTQPSNVARGKRPAQVIESTRPSKRVGTRAHPDVDS